MELFDINHGMIPIDISVKGPMTDAEFISFCRDNEPYQFEMDEMGRIIVLEPTGTFTGFFNAKISGYLFAWNEKHNLGFCFDSSTGFRLPNRAVRSPDATFIFRERWESLGELKKQIFVPICPDFVVELASSSDSIKALQDKMQEYLQNGCQLGWLIDLKEEQVWVYRPKTIVQLISGFGQIISATPELPGFEMDLRTMKS